MFRTFMTFLMLAAPAAACLAADALPKGLGLAAKYPSDAGIARDEAVVFAENFDEGSVADVVKRWAGESTDKVISFSDDAPNAAGRSLKITATPGKDTGGHLYTRLAKPLDKAFVRFYVKFPDPANYIHHFVHVGGYSPATAWPQGGAGTRPAGDKRFTVGIEPFGSSGRLPAPGNWNFYAYWHEMKASAGNRYWGNGLQPAKPRAALAGKWQCVELMIQLNTVGKRDGELALWLEGEPVMHLKAGTPRGPWTGYGFVAREEGGEPFEGFDFRTTADLKVNFLWLLHYVTEENNQRNKVENCENPVWFDQIVVARDYIGPLQKAP